MLKKGYILLVVFILFGITSINAQYIGGSGGGYDTARVATSTCTYLQDYTLLFYAGGSGGGYDTAKISTTACPVTINTENLIYFGGNGGGYDTAKISTTVCPVTINLADLIYFGGNGGGYDTAKISTTTCPAPENYNFYYGSAITVGSSKGQITPNTTNQTGPFIIAAADNYSIVKGDCIALSTTGTGATSFAWSQSVGTNITSTNIQNTTAKPTQNTVYTVTTTGAAAGCRNVSSVSIIVIDLGVTTITYPTSVCNTQSTNQFQYPILTGFTNGTYTISPSTGMTIDAKTGAIKTYGATVQAYTITYTYGTACTTTTTASVSITNNCATNSGVINYTNMYTGGLSSLVVSSNQVIAGACAENPILESKIFSGGLSNNITSSTTLSSLVCPANINLTNLIYSGGFSNNVVSNNSLVLQACSFPVGDNFYLGGTGMGYNVANKTPTTTTTTGTTVAVSKDTTICPGSPVSLVATGATNFSWTPATNLSNTLIANPIANPRTTTTYTVLGAGGVGCINTAKVTVNVIEDTYTSISYGAFNFDETDMGTKKVNILGPLTGTFSSSPSGLFYSQTSGAFTPGLSTSGPYAINYNYTKGSCNYTYVSNINITTLPPSITYPTPSTFFINYNGVTSTPVNIGGRAAAFEALDALPTGLTIDGETGIISGKPISLLESALVRIRAYNYNKVGAVNYSNVFTINISVRKPIISTTTSSVVSLNTKYGSASPIDTINLSGQYIIQNISVTAPSGFEVSNSTSAEFKNKVTISQSGTNVSFTKVYIRLASTANVGNFSGNVILSSDAADTTFIPISTSYVAPAPLNITAKYFQKFYGSKITLGSGSINFIATGLVNEEMVGSVTIVAAGGTNANDAAGLYDITPSLAVDGTFNSSNYDISYTAAQFEVLYSLYNFQMTSNASNWVQGKVPIPKINGGVISNLTNSSLTFTSIIPSSYINIVQRGVCWNTSVNPTILDNRLIDATTNAGSMTSTISGLTSGTNYFIRTFIKVGNFIYYGPNMKCVTL